MSKTKSAIYWRDIKSEGEINGRWVIEAQNGTLIADPAPVGTDDSLTFTAPNGKRYWDTTTDSQWTPRT
jgi:DNA-binding beta-propeller fold protein YncE